MKTKIAAALVCLVLACAGGLLAQGKKNEDANIRSAEGVVTDKADNPVAGAVVQLKDMKTLQVRSFITQQDGRYHFAGLSTNVDYELQADHDGASSGTKRLTLFDNRKIATINLKLNP